MSMLVWYGALIISVIIAVYGAWETGFSLVNGKRFRQIATELGDDESLAIKEWKAARARGFLLLFGGIVLLVIVFSCRQYIH